MAARQALPGDIYYRFRDHMNEEYREQFIEPLRGCLAEIGVALRQDRPLAQVIRDCKASGYLAVAWPCNQAVLHVFYEPARGTIDVVDESVIAAHLWLRLSVRYGL